MSSSTIPNILAPLDLLITEFLSSWDSLSLDTPPGHPTVSAAFYHFTISNHFSCLHWKSLHRCRPTAVAAPPLVLHVKPAQVPQPSLLLWVAEIKWNQSHVGTNCSTFHFMRSFYSFIHMSLFWLFTLSLHFFFSIPFCNCSTPWCSSPYIFVSRVCVSLHLIPLGHIDLWKQLLFPLQLSGSRSFYQRDLKYFPPWL